jgi:putative ABC transport system permease protein
MRYWELLCLALGGVRRTPLRVTLTAFGVTIATGALVSMVGFALGLQARVEEPFQRMELANRIDVYPRSPGPESPSREEGSSDGPAPALDEGALGRIAALPGVVLAYPELRVENVQILGGPRSRKVTAAGLPREAARLRYLDDTLVAGRFFQPGGDSEAVLGDRLARKLGFVTPAQALGATLDLEVKGLTPGPDRTFRLQERRLTVTVVGVWSPPAGPHSYPADGLVLPLDLIRDLPGVRAESALERLLHGPGGAPGYARVVVRVCRPADLFAVDTRLREMGFRTETLLGRLKEIRTAFLIMECTLTAVGGVALVVAALGIINTLLMAVLERYREIGTYKALGASDGDVRLLFLAEAGLVGLLGGLGGLLLGRVVSLALEVVVNAVARGQGIDGPVMVFAFPWQLLGGAVLFAVTISVLAGVYPASRAARVDPIRALRGE